MPKRPLTNSAKKIIADLARAKRPLSINQLASRNSLAWKTVSENAQILEKRKIIKCNFTQGKSGKKGKRACELTSPIKKTLGV